MHQINQEIFAVYSLYQGHPVHYKFWLQFEIEVGPCCRKKIKISVKISKLLFLNPLDLYWTILFWIRWLLIFQKMWTRKSQVWKFPFRSCGLGWITANTSIFSENKYLKFKEKKFTTGSSRVSKFIQHVSIQNHYKIISGVKMDGPGKAQGSHVKKWAVS